MRYSFRANTFNRTLQFTRTGRVSNIGDVELLFDQRDEIEEDLGKFLVEQLQELGVNVDPFLPSGSRLPTNCSHCNQVASHGFSSTESHPFTDRCTQDRGRDLPIAFCRLQQYGGLHSYDLTRMADVRDSISELCLYEIRELSCYLKYRIRKSENQHIG